MSANIIYNDINSANVPQGSLFAGKVFWLSHAVPQKTRWIDAINANGGRIHVSEDRADVKVVDTIKPSAIENAVTWKYIEKSLETGVLENEDDHRPPRLGGVKPGIAKSTGGSAPMKSTRTPFTAADDEALCQYVKRNAQPPGSAASELGRKIYQDFALLNSRHTAQSWQDRYKQRFHGSIVCDYHNRTPAENEEFKKQALKRKVVFDQPASQTTEQPTMRAEPPQMPQNVRPTAPDPNSFYVAPSFRLPPTIPAVPVRQESPAPSRFIGINQVAPVKAAPKPPTLPQNTQPQSAHGTAHVLLPPPNSSIIDAPLLEFPSQTSKASSTTIEEPRSRLNTASQRFKNRNIVPDEETEDEIAESQDRGDTVVKPIQSTISDTQSSPVEWSQSEPPHSQPARSAAQVLFPPPPVAVSVPPSASAPSTSTSANSRPLTQGSTLPSLSQILNKAGSTESPSQSTRESQLSGTDDNLSTVGAASKVDHAQQLSRVAPAVKTVANTSRKYDSAERSSGESQSTTASQPTDLPADSLTGAHVVPPATKPLAAPATKASTSDQPVQTKVLDEKKVIEEYKKRQRLSDWADDSNFSMEDAEALRWNAQDIEGVAPEDADEVWQAWADEHPHHAKDQWKSYYERHRILLLKYDASGDVILTTPPVTNRKRPRESDVVSSPLVKNIPSTISRHTATPKRRKLEERRYSPSVPSSLPTTPEAQRVWPKARQSSVNLSPPKSTQEQMDVQLRSDLIRSTPEGRRLSLESIQLATANDQDDQDDEDFEIVKVVDRTPSKAPPRPLPRAIPAPVHRPTIPKVSRPPPSTAPAALPKPTLPPSSSSRDPQAQIQQFFQDSLLQKVPIDVAQQAYYAATGNLTNARLALEGYGTTKKLAVRKGVWTQEDDQALMGLDGKKLQAVQKKHGDALMASRRKYLKGKGK